MRKFYNSVLLVLLVVFLSACTTNFDEVRVEDFRVNNMAMESLSKINIDASLKVNNPTKSLLTLKEADFDVLMNGTVIAHLRMLGETEIPAKSADYQAVPMELKVTNMIALLTSGIDLQNINIEKFVVNGSLKVKAGMWSKTFPVENMTLEQLMKSM